MNEWTEPGFNPIKLIYRDATREAVQVDVYMGDNLLGTLTVPQAELLDFQQGMFYGFRCIVVAGNAGNHPRGLSTAHTPLNERFE